MMGPFTAVNSVFVKAFTISGRASRAEYWWFIGFSFLVTIAAISFDVWSILAEAQKVVPNISFNPFDYFVVYWLLLSTIPTHTVTVRRLHDSGKTGFLFLLIFVPMIGSLILFILTLLPSDNDTNIYGQPPTTGGSGGGSRSYGASPNTGKPRAHNPMQGYALLEQSKQKPTPEMLAARKAEVRSLYEQRVLGKSAPA